MMVYRCSICEQIFNNTDKAIACHHCNNGPISNVMNKMILTKIVFRVTTIYDIVFLVNLKSYLFATLIVNQQLQSQRISLSFY